MPCLNRFLTSVALIVFTSILVAHAAAASPNFDAAPLPTASDIMRSPEPSSLTAQPATTTRFDDRLADAAARKISKQQLAALIKGLFAPSRRLTVDKRPRTARDSPQPPTYDGEERDGKYHLETDGDLVCPHFVPHTEIYEADCFGAFLTFAADDGSGGPDLQAAYANAKDKRAFARGLGRALQLSNDNQERVSNADIAWMQALPIGESRAEVYHALRSRHIVVYNPIFNPGRKDGEHGCNYEDTKASSAYPRFGQPVPVSGCGPDFPPMINNISGTVAQKSPSATAQFDLAFDLSCGYEKYVELDFDDDDRLNKISTSPVRHSCL